MNKEMDAMLPDRTPFRDGKTLEPTPFCDGTTLVERSSRPQEGMYTYIVVGKSARHQSDISKEQEEHQQHMQQLQIDPANQPLSQPQANQPQIQGDADESIHASTVDHIIRGNTSLDVYNGRDSTHVSSSLLLDQTAPTGVIETTLAPQPIPKGLRPKKQVTTVAPTDATARNDPPTSNTTEPRYRSYQRDQWEQQYQKLIKFKQTHGHCNIPHSYDSDPTLARWAKRQRYQYMRKQEQNKSCLSDVRQQKLEEVGFVWDLQTMAWQERFNELVEYVRRNGDCNVPSRFGENPALGMWVKVQRRQYKLYCFNQQSSRLTPERYQLLTNLGFQNS
ncbi:unnamed protein product [Cylindrotheca closterium]|uniref:Helicase-associated domain-containing protein n=1 Tax=Cylindrotheca closterium TaxID=2856 RepID=A0AAD2G156_9STRA|nr:unnamed protein product [Cylindrotheca closterium]